MRLFLLTVITMIAFAANSLLTRAAVAGYGMDPGLFAVVRTIAGAAALAVILKARGGPFATISRLTGAGAVTLALYMVGFSLAYLTLDAGIGALVLFGGVQVTMFAGAVLAREPVPLRRWIGAAVSMAGLGVLVWPRGAGLPVSMTGIGFMAAAAVGWGLYSLLGRRAGNPLQMTATNFALAVPLVAPLLLMGTQGTVAGYVLAGVAGAVTSGLGYAMWYAVVPSLGAGRAAVAQLSVPVLTALGGAVVLAEVPDLRYVAASALVLGGIAIGLLPPGAGHRKMGSSGS